ncbi:MAG: hypothetical protein Ct9H300mP3_08080 [Gammaproteobacteria bacterium]|nr:MAG: hypothetical protein Ct9H300mP3_08080 [Gammaproteobacteria bacterium]
MDWSLRLVKLIGIPSNLGLVLLFRTYYPYFFERGEFLATDTLRLLLA